MKRISRSATRQIAALKERLTVCTVYRLSNDFHGKDVEPKYAWEALATGLRAKLYDYENGKWVVHIHDNYWYELREGDPKTIDADPVAFAKTHTDSPGAHALMDEAERSRRRLRAARLRAARAERWAAGPRASNHRDEKE